MKKWKCLVCGQIVEGENPPEACPLCKAPAEKFVEVKEEEMTWAAEHVLGVAKGVSQEIIDGLTGNDAEGNKLHCLDLVNDTTLKANLVTFGVTSLPMLEQVKDQTVVQFPLTDLVTLIRSTGFPEGDYVFTLELEDNSNQKYEVSLTFYNPAY